MKVFLISPACLDIRITDDDAMSVPIGLFYIGALLKEKGFDVEVINLASLNAPVQSLKALVKEHAPDIVGFSVLHATRHSAMEAVAAVKEVNPLIKTVFGGHAPTFSAELFFKTCPGLDYIVKGEGEETFLELVRYLDAHSSEIPVDTEALHICGLLLKEMKGKEKEREKEKEKEKEQEKEKKKGKLLENRHRELIIYLDSLPHPAKYFDFQHISLSRGCPGRCRFCGSPAFWGKGRVRFHSTQWFVDEIELLIRRGRTHFFISDDTFTMSKQRVLAVCREIISRDLDITWQAISRVDFLDEDILLEMRRAGCIQISFGVESGSEKIRKTLGKPFKNEAIIKAFRQTVSYGILPRAYFIYGSPGETQKSIQQSVELIKLIKPLSMVSYILVLFPGTALYDQIEDQNLITPDIRERKIEDIPWFELDSNLDFQQIKAFGKMLRKGFYSKVSRFALDIELVDNQALYPYHADFLSRLAMTFSHGEYADHPDVKQQEKTAEKLYKRALGYAPDPRAYLGLAMLMQKKRDFSHAVVLLEAALDHFPDNRQLNICMAVGLMNMAQFKEALRYLEPFDRHKDVIPYVNACREQLKNGV